ncbi:MAG: NUDIX hydrolase [Gammaproteobacteria bacterium]|nr:NUDIX hydrolase [Gammaproteobacteria bacterium]NNK31767.1 NUDIX hydrolase [Xanthomonadales bacterium]
MSEDRIHFSGRYLRLIERDSWEFVSRSNARAVVVLIAVTNRDELVLVEQLRKPVGASVIELPAGLVGDHADPDESIHQAAGRELEEETGFRAARLELLMECPSSAGLTDEIISFVRADGLERVGPGGGDDSEDIAVHLVPRNEFDTRIEKWRQEGKPMDPKIFTGLYFLEHAYRGEDG